jgi:hypothetical protein
LWLAYFGSRRRRQIEIRTRLSINQPSLLEVMRARFRVRGKKDFVVVTDFMMRLKTGKRIHLCEYETNGLAEGLNSLFDREVMVPRIRHGSKQSLDTLICEEALLFAKFLRGERASWTPRVAHM